MKAKLVVLDEVNIKFEGLDVADRRKLVNSQKYFIPTARHMPAYKLGRWDGTASFVTLAGRSYLNLIGELVPFVENLGYTLELEDHRLDYDFVFDTVDEDYLANLGYRWPEGHNNAGEPIMIRDYQVNIINSFLENLQSIQVASTGSGKTLITAVLSKQIEKYGKTITIVPSKNLVTQTERDFHLLNLDVGVYYGDRKELDKTHTICTWQSLEALNKMSKKNIDSEENLLTLFASDKIAVISDETHSAKALVLQKILADHFAHCPIRFGLTGTMPKDPNEAKSIVNVLGPVVGQLNAHELQDQGVLSNCDIDILELEDSIQLRDYHEEKEYLLNDPKRLDWIAEFVKTNIPEGNTLILVDRVSIGKILADSLFGSVFISGTVKVSERTKHYKEVATRHDKIIIATYGVAAVGLDIPLLHNLVLIEPGKSFVRVIQSIGRGIRKTKTKDFVKIYDICSTAKYSHKHMLVRKQYYKDAKYPFNVKKIDWS